jgi:hypothetical protein
MEEAVEAYDDDDNDSGSSFAQTIRFYFTPNQSSIQ